VVLIFSVNGSSRFSGFALMTSKPGESRCSKTVFNGTDGRPFPGRMFDIHWIRHHEVFFRECEHITNSLNENKPVKIGRDGQEFSSDSGRGLCELIERHYVRSSRDAYHDKDDDQLRSLPLRDYSKDDFGHSGITSTGNGMPILRKRPQPGSDLTPTTSISESVDSTGFSGTGIVGTDIVDTGFIGTGNTNLAPPVVSGRDVDFHLGANCSVDHQVVPSEQPGFAKLTSLAAKLKAVAAAAILTDTGGIVTDGNMNDRNVNDRNANDGNVKEGYSSNMIDNPKVHDGGVRCGIDETSKYVLGEVVRGNPGLLLFPLDLTNKTYEEYLELHKKATAETEQEDDRAAGYSFPFDEWMSSQLQAFGSNCVECVGNGAQMLDEEMLQEWLKSRGLVHAVAA